MTLNEADEPFGKAKRNSLTSIANMSTARRSSQKKTTKRTKKQGGIDMYLASQSKKSVPKRISTPNPQVVEIHLDQHKNSAPEPFHDRMDLGRPLGFAPAALNALDKDSSPYNASSRKFKDLVVTMEDKFHASVLASLLDPSIPFPLPGPRVNGFNNFWNNYSGVISDAGGVKFDSTASNPFYNGEFYPGAIPTSYQVAPDAEFLTGKYSRYSGRAIATVKVNTDANGAAEVWFAHDPTQINGPFIVFTPSTTGSYTGITRHLSGAWQSNPYTHPVNYVVEGPVTTPLFEVDVNNTYFTGGALLDVHVLNRSAFLSVSFQTRTGSNANPRFLDTLPQLWATQDPSVALNLRNSPSQGQGAVSMYTGATWHSGLTWAAVPGEPAAQAQYSEYFRRCWAAGAPFVRAVVRTSSGGVPAAGVAEFQITLLNWVATAPRDPAMSAAMPLQTIPFSMPTWATSLRTRGFVYSEKTGQKLLDNLWNEQVKRIQENMTGNSPLAKALASAPKQAIPEVLKAATHAEVAPTGSWLDSVVSGIGAATKLVAGVESLASLIGGLLL